MWIWNTELQQAGFRQRSVGYWRAERRFGLSPGAYVSVFPGGESVAPREGGHDDRNLLDVSAFHVTIPVDVDRLHFYYHEAGEGVWEPGGHTSSNEIRRHGVDPRMLREQADAIAARVVVALRGVMLPRG
jgi:hypothetical protein